MSGYLLRGFQVRFTTSAIKDTVRIAEDWRARLRRSLARASTRPWEPLYTEGPEPTMVLATFRTPPGVTIAPTLYVHPALERVFHDRLHDGVGTLADFEDYRVEFPVS